MLVVNRPLLWQEPQDCQQKLPGCEASDVPSHGLLPACVQHWYLCPRSFWLVLLSVRLVLRPVSL